MVDPAPRTIAFSFDGTGNEPQHTAGFQHDESFSNVLKLHILLGGGLDRDLTDTNADDGAPQHTFHYNGVGTREEGETTPLLGSLMGKARRLINSMLAPSWGDPRRFIKEPIGDLSKLAPTPNDRIVVFGFSRGAAIARKFASCILDENDALEIAFLGVYDTVAAMDGIHTKGETISSDVVFENASLNTRISLAVHIVLLDENRIAFEPTLINRDDANPNQIIEVWFPGVHSDIGNGYWHDGLADVSLSHMIDACKTAIGDRINIAPPTSDMISRLLTDQGEILQLLDVDDILIHPNVTGMVHRHTTGLGKIYPKDIRRVCVSRDDKSLPTSEYRPLVHHSVKARFDLVAECRPAALSGVELELLLPDRSTTPISGICGLREHDDPRPRSEKLSGRHVDSVPAPFTDTAPHTAHVCQSSRRWLTYT